MHPVHGKARRVLPENPCDDAMAAQIRHPAKYRSVAGVGEGAEAERHIVMAAANGYASSRVDVVAVCPVERGPPWVNMQLGDSVASSGGQAASRRLNGSRNYQKAFHEALAASTGSLSKYRFALRLG